jgi:hypothetical protein
MRTLARFCAMFLRYVRYEMTTSKRIEKTIKLTPVEK